MKCIEFTKFLTVLVVGLSKNVGKSAQVHYNWTILKTK